MEIGQREQRCASYKRLRQNGRIFSQGFSARLIQLFGIFDGREDSIDIDWTCEYPRWRQ